MWFDRSAVWLFLANGFTIALAVVDQWDLSLVMWIYWGQSVIIGYFNWKRMRGLKRFSTEGLTMNNRAVPADKKGRNQVSSFFAVHYGFFHLGYLAFLASGKGGLSAFDALGVVACVIIFFYNHRFSYGHNLEQDLQRVPNIGTMMFFPYARIIPMHLTIILGDRFSESGPGALIFFLALKTLADWIMHVVEHRPVR